MSIIDTRTNVLSPAELDALRGKTAEHPLRYRPSPRTRRAMDQTGEITVQRREHKPKHALPDPADVGEATGPVRYPSVPRMAAAHMAVPVPVLRPVGETRVLIPPPLPARELETRRLIPTVPQASKQPSLWARISRNLPSVRRYLP